MMSQKPAADELEVEPMVAAKSMAPQFAPTSIPPKVSLLKKPLVPGL
jgi:hypothetical protein